MRCCACWCDMLKFLLCKPLNMSEFIYMPAKWETLVSVTLLWLCVVQRTSQRTAVVYRGCAVTSHSYQFATVLHRKHRRTGNALLLLPLLLLLLLLLAWQHTPMRTFASFMHFSQSAQFLTSLSVFKLCFY